LLLLLQEEMGWETHSTPSTTTQLQDMLHAAQNDAAFENLWKQQGQLLSDADQLRQRLLAALNRRSQQLSRPLSEQQQQLLHDQQKQLVELWQQLRDAVTAVPRRYPLQGNAAAKWASKLGKLQQFLDGVPQQNIDAPIPALHYVWGSRKHCRQQGLALEIGGGTLGAMTQITAHVDVLWGFFEQLQHAGDVMWREIGEEHEGKRWIRTMLVVLLRGTPAADQLKQQLLQLQPEGQWLLLQKKFEQVPDSSKVGGPDQQMFEADFETPLICVKTEFHVLPAGKGQKEHGYDCMRELTAAPDKAFQLTMCRLNALQLLAYKLQGWPAADQPQPLQQLLHLMPKPAAPEQQLAATETQKQRAAVIAAFGEMLPRRRGAANAAKADGKPAVDGHDEEVAA
jgi:hypothetical protein